MLTQVWFGWKDSDLEEKTVQMILLAGGFVCGLVAGAAARYGRLCSMGAIEHAAIGGNWWGIKAWGLALASAVIATQTSYHFGLFDPLNSFYATSTLDWPAALLGGVLFGFGMALVGTCSFGLLVRLGSGDLRALVTSIAVGIIAMAVNNGALTPLRMQFERISTITLDPANHAFAPDFLATFVGTHTSTIICRLLLCVLFICAAFDEKLLRKPRLIISAIVLGLAVAGGWVVTGWAYETMETARVESLSFVAPGGRTLLQLMSDSLRDTNFSIATLFGVVTGSLFVAKIRQEVCWEAFDDVREMRRHILGGLFMGFGGVLAKGCTIGQGISAGSVLSISMPIVVFGIFIGAKIGLAVLIGHPFIGWLKSQG